MITKEFTPATAQQSAGFLNTKLLGTLGMLGSPMLLIEGFYAGFQQHGTDQFIGALGAIYMGGWLCPEALHLEIKDDGIGVPADHHAGVGLNSMRERAEELGGECIIEALPGGGSRVWARLPLGDL
jgi:hypothetical protein